MTIQEVNDSKKNIVISSKSPLYYLGFRQKITVPQIVPSDLEDLDELTGTRALVFLNTVISDPSLERQLKESATSKQSVVLGPSPLQDCAAASQLAMLNVRSDGSNIVGISANFGAAIEFSQSLNDEGLALCQHFYCGEREFLDHIGAMSTKKLLDTIDKDRHSEYVVLTTHNPSRAVVTGLLERLDQSSKQFLLYLPGIEDLPAPKNTRRFSNIRTMVRALVQLASSNALKSNLEAGTKKKAAVQKAKRPKPLSTGLARHRQIRGLFASSGTCEQAQYLFLENSEQVTSNEPVAFAGELCERGHKLINVTDQATGRADGVGISNQTVLEGLTEFTGSPAVGVIFFELIYMSDSAYNEALAEIINCCEFGPAILIHHPLNLSMEEKAFETELAKIRQLGIHVHTSIADAVEQAIYCSKSRAAVKAVPS